MLKPDAVENGHIGKILDMIIGAGFKIIAMKYTSCISNGIEPFHSCQHTNPNPSIAFSQVSLEKVEERFKAVDLKMKT